jgi:hypothetical protein
MARVQLQRGGVHNIGHIMVMLRRAHLQQDPVQRGNMRGLGSGSFDPKTLAILEAAFDEAWLTLKCNGNDKVRANELARCILRLATEGERAPVRQEHRACGPVSGRPAHCHRQQHLAASHTPRPSAPTRWIHNGPGLATSTSDGWCQ